MGQSATLADRIAVLRDALPALRGLAGDLHRASGAELAEVVGLLDAVSADAARERTAAVAHAVRRGEVDGTLGGWIRQQAPSLQQGGASAEARLVTEATKGGPLGAGDDPALDSDSPLAIVWDAVTSPSAAPDGAEAEHECRALAPLTAANGLAVLHEMKALAPRLRDEAVPTVTRVLIALALEWGPAHMRKFRPALLAEHGREGELDDLHDKLAKAAYLSSPQVESGGLTDYRMALTPAQAAALEAAIGPLSAPRPNAQTGERDLRPAGQRRVEALAEVCQRALAEQADDSGDTAAGAYATVHVNLNLEDLRTLTGTADVHSGFDRHTNAADGQRPAGSSWSIHRDAESFRDLLSGEVLGSPAYGTLLSPTMLRQIACSAHLIPHVLGSHGEHLDQGRKVRLFNRPQRRALLRRDKHCTYPGCDRPGSWCRAHHVLHWLDDGTSDLDNAAMLCERHHTVVHQRRLWAEVRTTPDEHGRYVVWDLVDGSYDRELEQRRAERARHDPPRLTPALVAELAHAAASTDPAERGWAAHLGAWYDSPPEDWDGDDPDLPWPIHDPLIWDESTQSLLGPVTAA